jgi:hypothetical protein
VLAEVLPVFHPESQRGARKFVAIAGIDVRQTDSGEHTGHGKMSKRGSRYLRTAVMQAAEVAVFKSHDQGKKIEAQFDGGAVTSDAGVLFLREVDQRTGIIDRVVGALRDWRDPRYVLHSLSDLIRQRVFQIALGYEDADDADTLRGDPALKAACERLPITGIDLPFTVM